MLQISLDDLYQLWKHDVSHIFGLDIKWALQVLRALISFLKTSTVLIYHIQL